MSKIIAVTNPKGGVAKSTSASSIASLAAKHGRVLLIDLDPQGTCTYLAGLSTGEERNASLMFQDKPVNPSELAQSTPYGFDIVASTPNLISAVDWIASTPVGEQRLKMLLRRDKALADYDYVIFDTAGDRGRLLVSVLLAVDSLLIPVRPSAVVTTELVEFVGLVDDLSELRESMGQTRIHVDSVFFTLIEESGGKPTIASRTNIEDVTEGLDGIMPVALTTIPTSTAVEKAALMKKPVVDAFPDEKVSQRYRALFDEVYVNNKVVGVA